jgi:hypothetical protein
LYHDVEEFESFRIEALVPSGKLPCLLVHLAITTALKYRIKEIPRLGQVEFRAIREIFHRSKVVNRHTGPAFRASKSDAMVDVA